MKSFLLAILSLLCSTILLSLPVWFIDFFYYEPFDYFGCIRFYIVPFNYGGLDERTDYLFGFSLFMGFLLFHSLMTRIILAIIRKE